MSLLSPADAAALGRVTVITVTYNSAHCVPALAAGLADCPHVTVVDNASADDSRAAVARQLPQAKVFALPSNQGYGAANNAGIAAATTPYVLLLNPDCVVAADQIAELVRWADGDVQSAMWVPQLTDGAGGDEVNYSMPRHWGAPRTGGAEGPLCVGYACAAVLLIHVERLRASIGGFFDPRFFLYYEDEDLCLRAFDARAPIVVLPQVRIAHLARGSVRGPRPWRSEYWRGWHHAQSKIRFAAKHQGAAAGVKLLARSIARARLLVAARVLALSPRLLARAWGRLQGLLALRDSREITAP
ncbi:glycosyltransferase family 2 protein [Xylophilus sp.]|uniref:glycosyltransferase family 2 protein n=1 Tax=Xylophilus sp. TaxID=2653893 RepID=UPI0013BB4BF9|nr:glycosyltransferase family 2 protein [Xylophilus sp.]KAF1050316.1 MAG: N-acetylglucosaminyl-diphospho-decaprenol L-rhamnosyltransferase [Xylophilus sp.]